METADSTHYTLLKKKRQNQKHCNHQDNNNEKKLASQKKDEKRRQKQNTKMKSLCKQAQNECIVVIVGALLILPKDLVLIVCMLHTLLGPIGKIKDEKKPATTTSIQNRFHVFRLTRA